MERITLHPQSPTHIAIRLDGDIVGFLAKGEGGWHIHLGDEPTVTRRLFERALEYVARTLEAK
jgi:hypothetical protein